MLLEEFRDPPAEYGSVGMWWWDAGHLTEDRIKGQIIEMQGRGVATSCISPIYGPGQQYSTVPEYFTDEWWAFVKYSLEEQKKIGMEQWFCDWLGRCDKQYWQNKLRAEENPLLKGRRLVIDDIPQDEEILDQATYKKTANGLDYDSRRPIEEVINNRYEDADKWQSITISSQEFDLDYLNKDMVNRWIEIYFAVYEDKVGEHFGDTLMAYMPDERTVMTGNVLYSDKLLDRFKAEKGYDPLPYLVGLFYDIGDMTDKIRCDYYDVMVTLMEENFHKPIADWLHERGMKYTTHAMWGKGDVQQGVAAYGDYYRMMRNFDIPGGEDLRFSGVDGSCFRSMKLATSIAHLYEKERVLGESFWSSGWGVAPQHNLSWINEAYAYGVNMYLQLGALYGIFNTWQVSHSPTFLLHKPYWDYWRRTADYIKRLSYILSQGVHEADVAFLYPITSIHANWVGAKTFTESGNQTADVTFDLAQVLYESGIDLDFIDYESLCRAEVDDGKLKVAGMEFRALVLPPMTTIRTETVEKIREFADSGGCVVAYGQLPTGSPECGRDDPNIKLDVVTLDSYENVVSHISKAIPRDVIASEKDIFHTHRKIDDLDVYFLFNATSEKRGSFVSFRTLGCPEIWDAFTGEVKPLDFKVGDDRTIVHLEMEPDEAILVVFGSGH